MQNANRQSRVHSATMMRKLFLLLLIGAAVWFGARALVHRGEVQPTIVFPHPRDLSKGDRVVADGARIGVVTKVTHLDRDDAVSIRIDREHRRDVVSDSLFAIDHHRLLVTNSFAVGSPIADGAVLRARTDGVSSWLAKAASALQPPTEKMKRAADTEIEKLDEKHLDAELAKLKEKVPDWKAEGADALDHRLGEMKSRVEKIKDDLRRSNKPEKARKSRRNSKNGSTKCSAER